MTNQKDYRIELYRFMVAVIILFFHGHNVNNGLGHPIQLGHVFVEFFFFVSGYFSYAHIYKKHQEDEKFIYDKEFPLRYTWNKIKRLIPYMIMTFIFYFVLDIWYKMRHGIGPIECLKGYSGLVFDMGLLQITGICRNPQFNAWWYLSALLFALPIAVILFEKSIFCGRGYRYTIIVLPLITYGWFALTIDGLDWETWVFFIRSGFFRGLAGLCMGANIFCLVQYVIQKEKNCFCKLLLTFMEIMSYIVAVRLAYKSYAVVNATFLIVFLLVIGLIISFSNQTYTTKLNIKMFSILGEMATPLYVCHYSIGRLVGVYLSNRDINVFNRYLIYFGASIVFAGFMLMVHKSIEKRK